MAKPKYQIPDEEHLEQHRKDSQLAQAKRSFRTIARANIAIARDMQESGELDQLPPTPAPAVDPTVEVTSPPSREDQRIARSTMRQAPQSGGSGIYAFEGGYAFALITDHGYVAYRIPVEDDHILMTPGKTDYLYDSAGVRIPGWRITLSLAERPLLAAFDTGRDTVSAELDAVERSDRQGSAANSAAQTTCSTSDAFPWTGLNAMHLPPPHVRGGFDKPPLTSTHSAKRQHDTHMTRPQ